MKKLTAILAVILVSFTLFFTLRPIPAPGPGKFDVAESSLLDVREEGGPEDIVLQLADDDRLFYINRGMTTISPQKIKHLAGEQTVKVYFSNQWSLLDPASQNRHVYAVEAGDQMIYSEFN